MLEKVFGFLANKCKVEIYSKEEVDKKMGEIKTQSLTYVNEDTGANILVTFKRTGNIVECFCNAYLPANVQHTFATSDFTGEIPEWAYPDESFGKSQLNYNGTIDGYLLILLHKDGNISGLYQNLSTEYDRTILNQFTYIVDDSDTEYPYTYLIEENTLKLDFKDEAVRDATYTFSIENDTLTLIGGEGTMGGEYILERESE